MNAILQTMKKSRLCNPSFSQYTPLGLNDFVSPVCDEPLSGPMVILSRSDAIEHTFMEFLFGIQELFVWEMSVSLSSPQSAKTSILYLEDRRRSGIHSVLMGRYDISNQENIMSLRLSLKMGLLINDVRFLTSDIRF